MSKRLTQKEFLSKYCNNFLDDYEIGEYVPKKKVHIKCKKCGYEFESSKANIQRNGIKCPICYGYTTQTTDTFKARVKNLVGDEYSVLGEYTKAINKIKIKHNKCGYEYDVTPHDFLSGRRCPYCSHEIPLNNQTIDERLIKKGNKFKRVSDFIHITKPISLQCKTCNKIIEKIPNEFLYKDKLLCPYCDSKESTKIIYGFNTMDVTHKELLPFMLDKDFAYTHGFYTREKTYFKCPDCGKVLYKIPFCALDVNKRFICDRCGDGFSYPEKFFMSILDENGVDYVYQANKKCLSWCKNYVYDFYLPKYACIVETHGLQHYSETHFKLTLKEIQQNDKNKRNLAMSNNITNYIELDCRYSEEKYIKENILNNKLLSNIVSLNTDFDKCNEIACISKMKLAYQEFCNGIDKTIICQNLRISNSTLDRYIQKGKKIYD